MPVPLANEVALRLRAHARDASDCLARRKARLRPGKGLLPWAEIGVQMKLCLGARIGLARNTDFAEAAGSIRLKVRALIETAAAVLLLALAGFATLDMACATGARAAEPVRLVMVDATGCRFCAKWTADVGSTYAESAEGHFAPLER